MKSPFNKLVLLLASLNLDTFTEANTDLKKLPTEGMLPGLRPSTKVNEFKEGDSLPINVSSYLLPGNYLKSFTTNSRDDALQIPYEQFEWCER